MKKRILVIGAVILVFALLIFGGYQIDLLVNGERLPIPWENPRSVRFDRSELGNSKYVELTWEENKQEIREIQSFLQSIRWKSSAINPRRGESEVLYYFTVLYAHHVENIQMFSDGIRISGVPDPIFYYAENPEKMREEAERLDGMMLGK